LRFNHGKYALDEALVSRDCLKAPAIQELADKGVEALKNGQIITEWRPISSFPTTLETWTEIPTGSSITVTVESADTNREIVFTRNVELKSGNQKTSLTGLKAGTQVRLRIQLMENKWGSVPVMQTAILNQKEEALRWSTSKDWQKGTVSNGLKIGD
jgi:tetrahydromethanopterin S-methyltransferase subunit F